MSTIAEVTTDTRMGSNYNSSNNNSRQDFVEEVVEKLPERPDQFLPDAIAVLQNSLNVLTPDERKSLAVNVFKRFAWFCLNGCNGKNDLLIC